VIVRSNRPDFKSRAAARASSTSPLPEIWLVKKGKSVLTIKGKFGTPGKRNVTLYRKVHGKYRKVATATTTKSGKFFFRLTLTGSTLKLRAGSKLGSSQVLVVRR
jgi:hypothetical protein